MKRFKVLVIVLLLALYPAIGLCAAIPYSGDPQATTQGVSTNSSQGFVDAGFTVPNNCVGAVVTVETNPIRFGFKTTVTNDSGTALGHVITAGNSVTLQSREAVLNFEFVSKTAGSAAVIQTTFYIQ